MKKIMTRFKKVMGNKGFSLVELVIVVAIMAALVGILAPQYTKYVEKSRVAADTAVAETLLKATQTVIADQDNTTKTFSGETVVTNSTGTTAGTELAKEIVKVIPGYETMTFKSKLHTATDATAAVYTITVDAKGETVSGAWSAK